MVAAQPQKQSAGRHGLHISQHPVWEIPPLCLYRPQTRAYRPEVRGGTVELGKSLKQFRLDLLLNLATHFLQASSMS